MMRAFMSEWTKLMRMPILVGMGAAMVGFAVLFTALFVANADSETAPEQQPGQGGPGFPSLESWAEAEGLRRGFEISAQFMGLVALVFFAGQWAAEYGTGALRILLIQEPRRLHLLAGKLSGMGVFVLILLLVAFAAQALVAGSIATFRGLSLSEWATAGATWEALLSVMRTWVATLVWGLLGTALAILFRSSPPAIGIGIAYVILAEPIIVLLVEVVRGWLPGQAMAAFAAGGDVSMSMAKASILLVLYAAAFASAAGILFSRRDVHN